MEKLKFTNKTKQKKDNDWKQKSIHLHCIRLEAEISESDTSNLSKFKTIFTLKYH